METLLSPAEDTQGPWLALQLLLCEADASYRRETVACRKLPRKTDSVDVETKPQHATYQRDPWRSSSKHHLHQEYTTAQLREADEALFQKLRGQAARYGYATLEA